MTRDEIKYLALQELGYVKEPDFDADDDNAVNAINGVYEHLYDLALVSFDWCFCYGSAELEQEDNAGAGGWKYYYMLPDDLLYLRGVYADEWITPIKNYLNYDGAVFTNTDYCFIHYTKKVAEDQLPPYFVEYLKYKLAAKICQTLTGDMDLLKLLMMREQEAFAEAKNIDINQRPVRFLDTDAFIEVRN